MTYRAEARADPQGDPPCTDPQGGYATTPVECAPGTVLFMCTDGPVERRGEDIDVSERRLTELSLPAGGSLDDLLDEVLEKFGHGATDAIAVLASRSRLPAPEQDIL